MGVDIDITYEGDLHCRAVHGPSGAVIQTDAPTDNQGRGAAFSPTDMLATSLGVCMMTVMGIFARRHEIDLAGSKVHVVKEMVADPDRRVARLTVTIDLPASVPRQWREPLERAGMNCPVHKSLPDSVERPVAFRYSL